MAPLDKVAKRKASSPIEDDPLTLLDTSSLACSFPHEPSSAPKRSKVDIAERGGESTLVPASKASKTHRPSSQGKGKGAFTPELVAHEASGSCQDEDRPFLARPASS